MAHWCWPSTWQGCAPRAFPDGLDKFAQQKVRVRGQLEKYREEQMQIRIVTPDQIEIVSAQEP
jgi:hypothetical protein